MCLLSGLFDIKNSLSFGILTAIRNQKIILVTSPVILEEVRKVINRERIVKFTKMSEEERKDFINELIERSDVTAGKQLSQIFGRDFKDDKFLVCGVEGKVDYIVTGDDDLLTLKEYEGIKIVRPREFAELYPSYSILQPFRKKNVVKSI